MMVEPVSPQRQIHSVSELNAMARQSLEQGFGLVWVEAEISNLARPASGHWYFSLKDAHAQVRCAMFRNRNQYVDFTPDNGALVLVRARVSLYEPRGDFQLIIEHMAPAGEGALQQAFEALKNRLQAQGLFDSRDKRPLPAMPRQIGVITSPSGAAVRDILHVLKRRHPALPVIIYPTQVQGDGAAAEIRQMLQQAVRRNECDLLIMARGGGSLEDLWAFNDEALARAIHECPIPLISGIGHETDFTIADFVADVRAPTPSAAAEMASPDIAGWLAQLQAGTRQLHRLLLQQLQNKVQETDWLTRRLMQQHPQKIISDHQHQHRQLRLRLDRAVHHRLEKDRLRLANLHRRLLSASPAQRVSRRQQLLEQLQGRLALSMQQRQRLARESLGGLARSLHAVSPLQVLQRGYTLTINTRTGDIIRRPHDVVPGDLLETRLAEGSILSRVEDDD